MIKGLLKTKKRKNKKTKRQKELILKTKGRMVILSCEDIVGINDEECGLMFEI